MIMNQLIFLGKGKLEWQEGTDLKIEKEGEVLVRPFVSARCDIDLNILKGNLYTKIKMGNLLGLLDKAVPPTFGPYPFKPPFAFGHECIGEIVAKGEQVKAFNIGDKVIVPFQISCGRCLNCQSNLTGNCSSVGPFSMYGGVGGKNEWGGALSDLIRVPFGDEMLVKVPDGIDPVSIASAADNLPDAWRAVGPQLEQKPGATVLVVGGMAKSVGLYAAAMAKALGAKEVDYLDRNTQRLEIAKICGVNAVEGDYKSFRKKYDIVVDASNHPEGLKCAIRSVGYGGICTSVGIYFRNNIAMPLFTMYAENVTFKTGVSNARPSIPKVLELIKEGNFKPELVTTLTATWDETPQAFLENTTKVVVFRSTIYA